MARDSVKKLSRTYYSIIFVIAALFFILMPVIMVIDYKRHKARALDLLSEQLCERASAVDSFVNLTHRQMRSMKLWIEQGYCIARLEKEACPFWKYLRDDPHGEIFLLDVPQPDLRDRMGEVFGVGSLADLTPQDKRGVDSVLHLFQMQYVMHESLLRFKRSFYLSKNRFFSIYPASPSARRPDDLRKKLDWLYKSEFWRNAQPEKNPQRKCFWTLAYADESTGELMIGIACPIYNKDRFLGVVGGEIPLARLQKYVTSFEDHSGKLLIVNPDGQVMAGTDFNPSAASAVPSLREFLSAGAKSNSVPIAKSQHGRRDFHDGVYVFTRPLWRSNWSMVYITPESAVMRTCMPGFYMDVVLIGGVFLFLCLAYFFLRRNLIYPAMAMVRYIREEFATGAAEIPRVPAGWRPWFKEISEAMPLKAMAANIPGAMYQFARHGDGRMEFIFISRGVEDIFGVSADSLIGPANDPLELIPGKDRPAAVAKILASAESMGPFEFESQIVTPSGREKWVHFLSHPRPGEQGAIIWDGLMLDVTDRVKAETDLQSARDYSERIVNRAPVIICNLSPDGTTQYINPAGELITGYQHKDIVGRNWWRTLCPEMESRQIQKLQQAQVGDSPTASELTITTRQGKRRILLWNSVEHFDGDGNLIDIIGFGYDNTDRKVVEQMLQRRDAILHAVSEASEQLFEIADWEKAISEILRKLCKATETTGAFIIKNKVGDDGAVSMVSLYKWNLQDFPWAAEGEEDFLYHGNGLARWESILQRGESVYGPTDTFPPAERSFLNRYGIRSVALVPIFTEHNWWGFAGFCDRSASRVWSGAEVDALLTAARVFGAAIQRKGIEDELGRVRQREINIGSRIQQMLLLGHVPENISGARLAALTIPSQQIDGDFTDFIQHDRQHLDIVVGDVMGKGVPAALLGAAIKSMFLQAISKLVCASNVASLPTPEEIVSYAHQRLCGQLISLNSFATVCYARFDMSRYNMDIVDCGHTNVIHLHGDGQCKLLQGKNMPIGFTEWESYQQMSISLTPGDIVFFYSDGLIETRNDEDEMFGTDRLVEAVRKHGALEPGEMLREIYGDLVYFSESPSFADDMTCVVVKIEEPASSCLLHHAELEITSDFKELARLREFLRSFCDKSPRIDSHCTNQLELAVNEVASNIIRHAYRKQRDRSVLVEVEIREDYLVVQLSHWGEPLHKLQVSTPMFNSSQAYGFGLYMIRKCVDEIKYSTDESGKSCVSLMKRIWPETNSS
jgi:sigma-B regulation protein RsbU (phosphoserine phosphatase)